MGDYFDEMGWEPIPLEETQRHQNLLMIRELVANGLIRDDLAYDLPPPASKAVVRDLAERVPGPTDESCTICLKPNSDVASEEAKFKILPCGHEFHKTCIMPWLDKTNSCPLCRYEMVTDDVQYEEWKQNQRRRVDQEQRVEALHDSMFS